MACSASSRSYPEPATGSFRGSIRSIAGVAPRVRKGEGGTGRGGRTPLGKRAAQSWWWWEGDWQMYVGVSQGLIYPTHLSILFKFDPLGAGVTDVRNLMNEHHVSAVLGSRFLPLCLGVQ